MPLRAPGAGGGIAVQGRDGRVRILRQEPGVRTPIIDRVKQNLPGWFPSGDRLVGVYRPTVSVGVENVPVGSEGSGVPQLPPQTVKTVSTPIIASGGEIDRRDEPQNTGVVSKVIDVHTRDWFEFHELAKKGVKVKHWPSQQMANVEGPGVITPPHGAHTEAKKAAAAAAQKAPVVSPTKKPTATGKSMDLGEIITGLGKTYIEAKYSTPSITPVPQTTPVYSLPEMGADIVDFFTDPATGAVVPVKAKKPCRRRRRRRLATKSDLGDLAALKAILGNGEAFKAWIATHSR